MNKSTKVIFEEVSDATGLIIDERTETLIGVVNNYHLTIGLKNNVYVLYVSARQNGILPPKDFLKYIKKNVEGIRAAGIQGNNIMFNICGATKNKIISNLINATRGVTECLRVNGYYDVCECCGQPTSKIGIYNISGGVSFLCDDCYTRINRTLQQAEISDSNTQENVIAGVFGAFIGSLLGVLALIIIGQLGYVAAVSGVIMGFCTIKGYEQLGKKISTKGIFVSCIFMIVMTYLGVKIDWCISIADQIHRDVYDVFVYFWNLVDMADAYDSIIIGLLQAYAFSALGAVPTVLSCINKRKQTFVTYQMQ
ncbi:hypothetical protein [Pseudobutyrivibrio sp.]|uniref:hypothetical protein n=1 Tax=Pseudobutyrivibrio sp. TaxID=2014367 RepID=UPI001DB82E52|nr:hypothetical protein [Pseudobutyrivibrio sp.]MBE5910717.1 hypothetical protein [Pseudobutyrivibrio sp.]